MENKIDFLPERIRVQRKRRIRLVRQGYILVLCALTICSLGYVHHGRVRHAQAELTALDTSAENARGQLQLLASVERQQADLLMTKRIDDLLGSRVKAMAIMAELNKLMPESMALRNFSLETMEVQVSAEAGRTNGTSGTAGYSGALPARTEKRIRLILTGLAPTDVDVANFIGQLSASPLFEDVNMGYAKNIVFHGRGAREFQVNCYIIR